MVMLEYVVVAKLVVVFELVVFEIQVLQIHVEVCVVEHVGTVAVIQMLLLILLVHLHFELVVHDIPHSLRNCVSHFVIHLCGLCDIEPCDVSFAVAILMEIVL